MLRALKILKWRIEGYALGQVEDLTQFEYDLAQDIHQWWEERKKHEAGEQPEGGELADDDDGRVDADLRDAFRIVATATRDPRTGKCKSCGVPGLVQRHLLPECHLSHLAGLLGLRGTGGSFPGAGFQAEVSNLITEKGCLCVYTVEGKIFTGRSCPIHDR